MAQFRPDPDRAQAMTPDQALAMEAERSSAKGGWMSVVTTLMWTAGSLAVIVGVMLWAYGLGARDPADVPALAAGPDWRRAPAEADRGGLTVPGQEAQVYTRFGDATTDGDDPPRLAAVQDRPTDEDIAAARARAAALAEEPARSAPELASAPSEDDDFDPAEAPSAAVVDIVRQSAERPEAAARAEVIDMDLETPSTEAESGELGGPLAARPTLPPNVGPGSAPPPENAARAPAEPIAERLAAAAADAPRTPAPQTDETQTTAAAPPADAQAAAAAPSAETPAETSEPAAPAAAQAASAAPPSPARRPDRAVDRAAIAARDSGEQIYQVQLGALPSEEAVRRRWRELVAEAPQLLGAYTLDIQSITRGGSRLYRLRIGAFGQRGAAAQLCRQLRAQEIDCFAARR